MLGLSKFFWLMLLFSIIIGVVTKSFKSASLVILIYVFVRLIVNILIVLEKPEGI